MTRHARLSIDVRTVVYLVLFTALAALAVGAWMAP